MAGNLLIVDDEPQICSALTRLLRTDGYSISHALSPIEGLKLMGEQPFDVVISDYMMPGVNGVEFLSEVSQAFPDTVRLMLSGQADMNAVIDAVNSGSIFKFVLKPWSNDGLRNTVREAFERSAESTEQFDKKSGWLTRSVFLSQDITSATGAIMVVGEWINAADCITGLSEPKRIAIFSELSKRVEQTLDLTGDLGHVEEGTFACIAADEMSEQQWQQLNAELRKPLAAGSALLHGSFRLGLSRLLGRDLKVPLKQALIAVSTAAIGASQFYTRELGSQVHRRRTLESDLNGAIERNELYFEFQPQLDTQTQNVVSAESLLRWKHPRLGPVSPMDVIDMAEQSELINDIGFWTVRECCKFLAELNARDDRSASISLNVSPRQFLSGNIISDIQALTDEHQFAPDRLEVEITESCIMSNPEEYTKRLNDLSATGVRIALDDFGTGQSSRATLSHLPIDTLKVDRSLISDLTTSTSGTGRDLLEHIVTLAKSLNVRVVAEGVETQEQANICSDLGCDLLQGYLVSKPISAEDFFNMKARIGY